MIKVSVNVILRQVINMVTLQRESFWVKSFNCRWANSSERSTRLQLVVVRCRFLMRSSIEENFCFQGDQTSSFHSFNLRCGWLPAGRIGFSSVSSFNIDLVPRRWSLSYLSPYMKFSRARSKRQVKIWEKIYPIRAGEIHKFSAINQQNYNYATINHDPKGL